MTMPQVFLSHSTHDRRFVECELLPTFEKYGIASWYAPKDIQTTEEWERMILQGLKSCDWFLVVLSENASASEWVRTEVHWAIENRKGRLIPLFYRNCNTDDIHLRLRTIHYVDFRIDTLSGRKKLLKIWGKHVTEQLPDFPSNILPTIAQPTSLLDAEVQSNQLTLPEQLVLLSRDERTGTRLANDLYNPKKSFLGGYTIGCFSYALHGAALAELLLRGLVTIHNGSARVFSSATTGDQVLDRYLRACLSEQAGMFPSDGEIGTVSEKDVLAQLVMRGCVRHEAISRLWIFTESIYKPMPESRLHLAQYLTRAMTVSPDAIPRRVKILLALLHESDNWALVAPYAGDVSRTAELDRLIGTSDEVVAFVRLSLRTAIETTISVADDYNARATACVS